MVIIAIEQDFSDNTVTFNLIVDILFEVFQYGLAFYNMLNDCLQAG